MSNVRWFIGFMSIGFILLCLIPTLIFGEVLPGLEVDSQVFENQRLAVEFETTAPVSVECVYPRLRGDTPLIRYVNASLEAIASQAFVDFVDSERSSREILDPDFGPCILDYRLAPVCCLPTLISICGSEYQGRCCPHGWTHYIGKTYWQNETTITELHLKDLFLQTSDWSSFLVAYCDQHFRSVLGSYYVQVYNAPFQAGDLETFVLTPHGLTIVFRSYVVGGWADGPHILTIPYTTLQPYIDLDGPLREISQVRSLHVNVNSRAMVSS